jgi:uncharacterized sulfatase
MQQKPNILWVTLESVRADHTQVYGYERRTTPKIQAEADRSDATVLSTPISQSMWTPAATASILTGTYLSTHRLGQDGKAQQKLRQDIDTLPELLRDAGYETALFTPNSYISSSTGLDRGFDTVEDLHVDKNEFLPQNSSAIPNWNSAFRRLRELRSFSPEQLKKDVSHNPTATVPVRFKRWRKRTGSPDEPFFAYAHLDAPHHPYQPVSKWRDTFTSEIPISTDEAQSLVESIYDGSAAIKRQMAQGLDINETQWAGIKALYDAEIRFVDTVAGRLIESARNKSERDLIVIVTGDHGDLFGEYGLLGHNLVLHDGLIRVPLIVTGIDDIKDGTETATQHIDVTKTLASIAGVNSEQFEGRDIRDADREFGISQRGVANLEAYTKFDQDFEVPGIGTEPISAVRTADFKYVEGESTSQLYKLPNEMVDVSEQYPEAIKAHAEILSKNDIEWVFDTDQAAAEFDEAAQQRLQDLGYLTD